MTVKGYPSFSKLTSDAHDFATVNPSVLQQIGLDTLPRQFVQLISAAKSVTSATTRVITCAAHGATRGDVIYFTSGALSTYEFRVQSVTTNTFTLSEQMPSAPAASDLFSIYRYRSPTVSSSGGITITGSLTSVAPVYADSVRYTYSTAAVGVSSWVQLIAATAAATNYMTLFDSSGQTLELGVGAALSEARKLIIPPGGIDGQFGITIAAGARVSVRALSATTGAIGEINITCFT